MGIIIYPEHEELISQLTEHYQKEKDLARAQLEENVMGAFHAPNGIPQGPDPEPFVSKEADQLRFKDLADMCTSLNVCYVLKTESKEQRKCTKVTENMLEKGSAIIGLCEILYRNLAQLDIDQICNLVETKLEICKELEADPKEVWFKQSGKGAITKDKAEADPGDLGLAYWELVVKDYRLQFQIAIKRKINSLHMDLTMDHNIINGWVPNMPDNASPSQVKLIQTVTKTYEARVPVLQEMGWKNPHGPKLVTTNTRSADQLVNMTHKDNTKPLPKYESTVFSTKKDVGSVFQWLRMFERLCTSNDVTTDPRKIKWLAKALDPCDAMLWNWYHKIDSDSTAWEKVKEDFVLQFAPAHERSPAEIWTKIMLVPKTAKETIRNFGSSFQAALDNLDSANSIAIEPLQPTSTQICRAWLKCVGDKALSNTFSSQIVPGVDFPTFMTQTTVWKENNDAVSATLKGNFNPMYPLNTVSAAMPKALGQPTSGLRSGIRHQVPNTGRPTNPVVSKPAATQNAQKESKDLKDEIDALTSNLNALHIKLGQKNTGYTGPQSGTPQSRSCYRCGQEGHLARECTVDRTEVLPTYRGFKLEAATYDLPDDDDWYNPELEDYYLDYYTWMMRDNQYEQDFQQGC